MSVLISLNGNSHYLYNLERTNSPHFSIFDDSDDHEAEYYLLRSNHFNRLEDKDELESAVKGMLQLINGALALSWGYSDFKRKGALSIDRAFKLEAGASRNTGLTNINLSGNIPPSNPFVDGGEKAHPLFNPFVGEVSAWIQLCSSNDDVFNILRQSSVGFDWRNLFCIWDTIFYYCTLNFGIKGEKNIADELGFDKTAAESFRGTANSFEVLGLECRHGVSSWTRPKNVMSQDEAIDFIYDVVKRYLGKRYCLNCNLKKWEKENGKGRIQAEA